MDYVQRLTQLNPAEGRKIAAQCLQYEQEYWQANLMRDALEASEARQNAAQTARAEQAAVNAKHREAQATRHQQSVAEAEQAAAQAAAQLLQVEEAEAAGAAQRSQQQAAKKAAKKARQRLRKQVAHASLPRDITKLAEMPAIYLLTQDVGSTPGQHVARHAWQIVAEQLS